MRYRASTLAVVLLAAVAAAQAPVSAGAADKGLPAGRSLHRLSLRDPLTDHVNYLLYVPPAYERGSESSWPLILFLHGSEQRGDDPRKLQDLALLAFAEKNRDFPFITIIPQCPSNTRWPPRVVKSVLDSVESMVRVDRNRVYLTGFSLGGYGTWQTAAAYPGTFAAIAPLCGMSDLPDTARLTRTPVWAFHGAQDVNVPVTESLAMVGALKKSGGNVQLTVYPDLAHDCWTMTYRDSRLYLWFLDHSLSDGARIAASSLSSDSLLER
jgi:predicted peptidase